MNRIGAYTKMAYDNVELHVGQDMPELKPVETGPLPPRTTGVASLVIEAGTIRGENRCSPLEAHEFSCGRMSLYPCFVRRNLHTRVASSYSQHRDSDYSDYSPCQAQNVRERE